MLPTLSPLNFLQWHTFSLLYNHRINASLTMMFHKEKVERLPYHKNIDKSYKQKNKSEDVSFILTLFLFALTVTFQRKHDIFLSLAHFTQRNSLQLHSFFSFLQRTGFQYFTAG